jgi:hypothetical protein
VLRLRVDRPDHRFDGELGRRELGRWSGCGRAQGRRRNRPVDVWPGQFGPGRRPARRGGGRAIQVRRGAGGERGGGRAGDQRHADADLQDAVQHRGKHPAGERGGEPAGFAGQCRQRGEHQPCQQPQDDAPGGDPDGRDERVDGVGLEPAAGVADAVGKVAAAGPGPEQGCRDEDQDDRDRGVRQKAARLLHHELPASSTGSSGDTHNKPFAYVCLCSPLKGVCQCRSRSS